MDTLWNAKPFLRILIAVVLGILLSHLVEIPIIIIFALIPISITAILIWMYSATPTQRYTFDYLEGILFFVLIISIGYGRSYVNNELNNDAHFSHHLDKQETFIFELSQPAEPKARSTQLIGNVISVADSTRSIKTKGKVIVYLKADSTTQIPNYGDQLLIKSEINNLNPPTNPGQFDYSAYQANENIYHSTFVKSDQWTTIKENKTRSFWSGIYKARNYLLSVVDKHVQAENEKAVASALLLGYRELLPKEIKDVYAHTGSMHVLAVSGLHVGIVVMLLNFLLRFLKRTKHGKYLHFLIIVSFVWLFALLTGFKPSVARAAVMFTFLQIGMSQKQNIDILHITIISAVALLMINPNNLFRAGFQLSYGALLGILFFQRRIYEGWFIHNRVGDYVWKITSVGIAAQIGTLPLGLYYFGFFPLVFFLSNFIIILAATGVLALGLTLFVVSPFEKLAALVGYLLEWVVWLINWYLMQLNNIPHVVIEDIQINGWQAFLMYLFISSITFYIIAKKKTAFQFALVVLLGFSVLTSFDSISKSDNQTMVVYDVSNNFCLGLHSGKESLIIHDFETVEDDRIFSFNVEGHLKELKTQSARYIHLNQLDTMEQRIHGSISIQNGFLQFGKEQIFIPTKKHRIDTSTQVLRTDYLIVPKRQEWNSYYLDQFVQAEKGVVYTGQFRPKHQRKQHELSVKSEQHFVRSDGAFILDID